MVAFADLVESEAADAKWKNAIQIKGAGPIAG
jgi:hypothetical protein